MSGARKQPGERATDPGGAAALGDARRASLSGGALALVADLAVVVDARGEVVCELGRHRVRGSLFSHVVSAHLDRARAAVACAARGEHVELDMGLTGPGVADVHHVVFAPAPDEPGHVLVCARRNGPEIRSRGALMAERTRFEVAVKHAPTSIEITDTDMQIQYVNEAWEALTGFAQGEAVGKSAAFRCVDHAICPEIERTVRTGAVWQGRLRSLRKDGSAYEEELTLYPGCDDNGRILHYVGIRTDVSESERLREAQMTNDRLVTMGTLTAGVAHEIKNALVPIIGGVSFLKDAVGTVVDHLPRIFADELDDALFDTEEAVERVRLICTDLNMFSRAEPGVKSLDLHRTLESSARIASDQFKRRATLRTEFEPVPQLNADQARLGQVFLNLILNAAHAIPPGDREHNEIVVRAFSLGYQRVVVEVSDTGHGIPHDVLPHIFEPFFTTKPAGEGTGLGLPICRRIVRDLRGDITVRSKVGQGTTFRVEFPVDPSAMSGEFTCPEIRAARSARILVVDDDIGIARSFARILKKHDVEVANGGREGLNRLLAEDFDLVFCDLVMPGVTGMDLHQALRRERPEVADAIIFMTAGGFSPKLRRFVETVSNTLVEKPFGVEAIRAVVASRISEF